MQLVLTEDQELLAKTAADFVGEQSPVSRMRALRDSDDPICFSKPLWKEMAELGWVGIPIPEAYGGAEMGLSELAVVLEALGRNLAPEPFLSTVLLGARALVLAGSEEQKEAWLTKVAEGDCFLSLAYEEKGSRYDLSKVETSAKRSGDEWQLDGEKIHVLDAVAAEGVIVSARHGDGISLFLVPADAAGLEIVRQKRVDSRGSGIVRLSGVKVPHSALVGGEGEGLALLERVIDGATVGLCAEMLGGMSQAFDLTLAYLKEREQFGAVIGSFQALKHRAARCFMEVELSRSTVMAAARAVDADQPDAPALVSVAKARCSDAFNLIANEGVQIFGGVGMTDEYDIGFYMKRARAAEVSFGDTLHHRDRWARLGNY